MFFLSYFLFFEIFKTIRNYWLLVRFALILRNCCCVFDEISWFSSFYIFRFLWNMDVRTAIIFRWDRCYFTTYVTFVGSLVIFLIVTWVSERSICRLKNSTFFVKKRLNLQVFLLISMSHKFELRIDLGDGFFLRGTKMVCEFF